MSVPTPPAPQADQAQEYVERLQHLSVVCAPQNRLHKRAQAKKGKGGIAAVPLMASVFASGLGVALLCVALCAFLLPNSAVASFLSLIDAKLWWLS